MQALNFVDRYSSTLASGYTSGGGSLSVSVAPTGVSGACNFLVIVQAEGGNTEEVFLVTNISGTTLTVTGAQAGTSASNHGSGAAIIGSIMTQAAYYQALGTQLLESLTASSSADLQFKNSITSQFDEYLIEFVTMVPATNTVDLQIQVSTNGGSSYDSSSNYQYATPYAPNSGATGTIQGNNQSALTLFPSISSTASKGGISGTMRLYNPGSTASAKAYTYQVMGAQATNWYTGSGAGVWNSTSAVNAFKVFFSSGNIASGTVRVYGVSKG